MALKSSPENSGGFWPQWNENKLFALLLAILLSYGIVLVGAEIRQTMLETRYIGVADREPSTISVHASAKTSVVPDIATVDLGVVIQALTAGAAQDQNTTKVNALLDALKEMGLESKDIKTSSYNVYPQYDYNASPARIVGYEASQTITVRVRDRELVSSVLESAGNLGVTNIGSLRFEIADQDAAEARAREDAIAKAYEQALAIADAMGARIGSVVSYSEAVGGDYPIYYDKSYAESAAGGSLSPNVSAGETEVEMTVDIQYSLR